LSSSLILVIQEKYIIHDFNKLEMAKPGHFFDFENNFACKHLEMSIRTGNTEDAL
jgi:hypothetical protein